MQEFEIRLRSVQDVQEFVALATEQPFDVLAGTESYKVKGYSFMEMFCLDFTRPMFAYADCTQQQFEEFRNAAEKFRVTKK